MVLIYEYCPLSLATLWPSVVLAAVHCCGSRPVPGFGVSRASLRHGPRWESLFIDEALSCDVVGMINDPMVEYIEFMADRLILVLFLLGISMHVLPQAHWGRVDTRRSGHSSGQFEVACAPILAYFDSQGRGPLKVEI